MAIKNKSKRKKMKPRNIRNKHAKQVRKLLKNSRRKVSASAIYYF
jgi:hypothetical protein